MKLNQNIIIIIVSLLIVSCSKNISTNNEVVTLNATGSLESLNIVTWNIENFPKNDLTEQYLKDIVSVLNIDIIALQEIRLLTNLINISSALGDNWVTYRSSGSSNYGNLAYLINTNEIDIITSPYAMPDEEVLCPTYAYDLSNHTCLDSSPGSHYYMSYDFAWRMPYILEFEYNNEKFALINVHLKCCGSTGSSEKARRYEATKNIDYYISNNLPEENIIIVGDFNDEINEIVNFDTESYIFSPFHDESLGGYSFTDMSIANGSVNYWSYPSYPSHIDHIVINNNIINNSNISYNTTTLLIENLLEGGWGEYNSYISDHRPLLINLTIPE